MFCVYFIPPVTFLLEHTRYTYTYYLWWHKICAYWLKYNARQRSTYCGLPEIVLIILALYKNPTTLHQCGTAIDQSGQVNGPICTTTHRVTVCDQLKYIYLPKVGLYRTLTTALLRYHQYRYPILKKYPE